MQTNEGKHYEDKSRNDKDNTCLTQTLYIILVVILWQNCKCQNGIDKDWSNVLINRGNKGNKWTLLWIVSQRRTDRGSPTNRHDRVANNKQSINQTKHNNSCNATKFSCQNTEHQKCRNRTGRPANQQKESNLSNMFKHRQTVINHSDNRICHTVKNCLGLNDNTGYRNRNTKSGIHCIRGIHHKDIKCHFCGTGSSCKYHFPWFCRTIFGIVTTKHSSKYFL